MFPEYTNNIEKLDWNKIKSNYSWVQDMSSVPQDAIFHAEGNVDVHTRMVLESMLKLDAFKNETPENKLILFMACLLHDVEKRSTTSLDENGRYVSPGHAKRGEYTARSILYREIPTDFITREKIAKLVRHHGLPLWVLEKPNPQKSIIESSIVSNNDKIALLAQADVLGRICKDADDLFYRIELFKEFAIENDCYNNPKSFKSDLARAKYFAKDDYYSDFEPFDDTKFESIIMCGIPGSGKDYYVENSLPDYPVISLDKLRLQEKIAPGDKSGTGTILQMAKEQAKVYMRKKQSFIWNATNLTKLNRKQLFDLFVDYGGKVKIVYVEVPYKKVLHQNMNREYPIPEKILERFIHGFEVPSITEAHQIDYVIDGKLLMTNEYCTVK